MYSPSHDYLYKYIGYFKPFVNIVHKKIYTVKQSFCDFCNILNSQNIAGNIANEQYQKKLMVSWSGDIELNPGPVFL